MNILGQKLKNASIIGQKLKSVQTLGKKLLSDASSAAIQGSKKAEVLLNQVGNAVDVGGRKVANTAGMVDRTLGRLQPYVSGTVLEGVSTGLRDLAKGTRLVANESRVVAGKDLVKLSERGLAEKVENEVKRFV